MSALPPGRSASSSAPEPAPRLEQRPIARVSCGFRSRRSPQRTGTRTAYAILSGLSRYPPATCRPCNRPDTLRIRPLAHLEPPGDPSDSSRHITLSPHEPPGRHKTVILLCYRTNVPVRRDVISATLRSPSEMAPHRHVRPFALRECCANYVTRYRRFHTKLGRLSVGNAHAAPKAVRTPPASAPHRHDLDPVTMSQHHSAGLLFTSTEHFPCNTKATRNPLKRALR